jgi:hypothetical protein
MQIYGFVGIFKSKSVPIFMGCFFPKIENSAIKRNGSHAQRRHRRKKTGKDPFIPGLESPASQFSPCLKWGNGKAKKGRNIEIDIGYRYSLYRSI